MSFRKKISYRKILLLLLTIFPISALIFFVYLSLVYDNISDDLLKAKQELNLGNKDKAYDIYYSIISKDVTCEEAYRALASLAEEQVNYKDAAYFYLMISNLNPIDEEARRNYFKSIIIAREDAKLTFRYEKLSDISFLGDAELLAIARAYIRANKTINAHKILDKIKSSTYKSLVKGHLFLNSNDVQNAEISFKDAAKFASDEDALAGAKIGLVTCYIYDEKIDFAISEIKKINTKNVEILSDLLMLEAYVNEYNGENKLAMQNFFELAKIRRYQISPLVKCLEFAYAQKDLETLANLKKLFPVNDKLSAELNYFISTIEAAIQNKWQDARKTIHLSGAFNKTPLGYVVELDVFSNAEGTDFITSIAQNLAKQERFIPTAHRKRVLTILTKYLEKNQNNSQLIEALLKIAPDNPYANIVNTQYSYDKNNFASALNSAKIVLQKAGFIKSVFLIACESAEKLKDFNSLLDLSENYLKVDTNDIDATVFAARANRAKNNLTRAKDLYLKAVEINPATVEIALEACEFILRQSLFDDFEKLLNFVKTVNTADNKILELVLKSEKAKNQSDKILRIKFLEDAIKLNPTSDVLQWNLASAYVDIGKASDAINLLKAYLLKNSSEQLSFRLAILMRSVSKENAQESLDILEGLSKKYPQDKAILSELSKTRLALKNNTKPIEETK